MSAKIPSTEFARVVDARERGDLLGIVLVEVPALDRDAGPEMRPGFAAMISEPNPRPELDVIDLGRCSTVSLTCCEALEMLRRGASWLPEVRA